MSWLETAPIGRREMLRTLAAGAAVAALPFTLARKTIAAVVAAADLVVSAGQTVVLGGSTPTVANFDTVTIQESGQIVMQGPVSLNVQTLVKQ